MSEDWVQWQGHVINGEFHLGEYLGGSDHSGVFLTELTAPEPRKAAIKFIFAHSPGAEVRFSRWKSAAKLYHPHLIRIFRTGRCELGNLDLLYAVMEFADEAVSQVLPYRALTPAEVRDILTPALDTLSYLHAHGFTHAHIEPANIFAVGDRVKLSSDNLVPLGQSDRTDKTPSPYHPPDAIDGRRSLESDVWSLGMTVVELLTQRLPVWEPPSTRAIKQADPALPETLSPPFLEIARNCLRLEPEQRWKIPDIAACLNPVSGKKARTASVSSPVASAKPPVRTGAEKKPAPATPAIAPSAPRQLPAGKRIAFAKPWPVITGSAVAVTLLGLLIAPRLFKRGSEAQPLPSSLVQSAPVGKPSQQDSSRATSLPISGQKQGQRAVSSPAALHGDAVAKTSAGARQPGEVLDHVVPDVPQKARDTIQGTVRVSIKVHVDRLGNVDEADFAARGPSKYFAELALDAARRWQFAPAKAGDQSVPSDWILRFEFSRTDTKVFPTPADS